MHYDSIYFTRIFFAFIFAPWHLFYLFNSNFLCIYFFLLFCHLFPLFSLPVNIFLPLYSVFFRGGEGSVFLKIYSTAWAEGKVCLCFNLNSLEIGLRPHHSLSIYLKVFSSKFSEEVNTKAKVLVNWRPARFSFWILKGHHHKRSIKTFLVA